MSKPEHEPHIYLMVAISTIGERLIHLEGFVAGMHCEAGPARIPGAIHMYVLPELKELAIKLGVAVTNYEQATGSAP